MTIYILDKDREQSSRYLDDKSLEKQINSITRILCDVHYLEQASDYQGNIPLKFISFCGRDERWHEWVRSDKSNYIWLLEFGKISLSEIRQRWPSNRYNEFRFNKIVNVIIFLQENMPDLKCFSPDCTYSVTGMKCYEPLPLILPKKYYHFESSKKEIEENSIVITGRLDRLQSYRNYYKAKIKNKLKICNKQHPLMNKEYNDITQNCFYPSWTNRKRPEWLEL